MNVTDAKKRTGLVIRTLKAAALAACIGAVSVGSANAAGLLIAEGGFGGVLEMKEHDVDVTINNGIAVTKVTQVFHNTEKRQVEALYTFPVPKGASVANFSMWIGGKEMVGEVLEKKRAREIYQSYKRTRRDPGLLEQVDYKTFEMRIFPIAPEADQKVEITYYQELDIDHDWARYVYPLATVTRDNIDQRVTDRFALSMEVLSEIPITELESPSHSQDFVMSKHTDRYVQASLETPDGALARDMVLAYKLSRPKTGIDVVASRERGDDGYFQLSLTVGEDLAALDTGMDYVFVMDISGSMANDGKLLASRDSVMAFINELGPEDRFEVMAFNIKPETVFGALRTTDKAALAEASEFLEEQRARGGTELRPALTAAYRYADSDRLLNVVVLSDGMTEQRERRALLDLIGSRPAGARVFCIGVGNEVNRLLLEQIASDSGGLAAFVSRGDNFERSAEAFRRKLTRPAMADIEIDFGGIRVHDVTPAKLPNLYHGSPLRVYGRYAKGGEAQITLKGTVQGREVAKTAALNLPTENGDNPEVERMWAWRRIDELQKGSNANSSRSIDEIVRLGETFSIVSEYTSFLVLENDAEYKRWKIDRKNALRVARDRTAQAKLRETLDQARNKAMADIGPVVRVAQNTAPRPASVTPRSATPGTTVRPAANTPRPATRTPAPRRDSGGGIDFDFGTGPVGPLFLGFAAWWARRRRQAA